MMIAMFLVGLVMFGVSSIVLLSRKENFWQVLFAVLGAVLLMFCIGAQSQINSERSISKEVDLTQISVSGQKNFRAQVQITYKDGELDSIVLIPKTTVPDVVIK